jgi:preprotein translocase subunit SecG
MTTLKLIFLVVQVISSVFLIAVVLLQSGKRSGLSGAIAGAADTFLSKNKARTWDARLARVTKWVAVLFLLLTLALNLFPAAAPVV